jgi:hypothetical protein
MRNTHFPPSVLAAILSACATESVNLNSERIEQRFGSYGIEVLASEAGLRRSSLFSYDGDTATCRTYAIVQFVEQLDERYNEAHSRVMAGGSIGSTFREDGWHVYQLVLVREEIELEYATIMEAHHPEYLTVADLLGIFEYDSETAVSDSDIAKLSTLLFGLEKGT